MRFCCLLLVALSLLSTSCGDSYATLETDWVSIEYPGDWVRQPTPEEAYWQKSVVFQPASSAPPYVEVGYESSDLGRYRAQVADSKKDPYPRTPIDVDVAGARETYAYQIDGLETYILALSEDAKSMVFMQLNAREGEGLDAERVISSLEIKDVR